MDVKVWSVAADGHSVHDIGRNCDMLVSALSVQWCPVAGVGMKPQMLLARLFPYWVVSTACLM